jgi:hypothetical protein
MTESSNRNLTRRDVIAGLAGTPLITKEVFAQITDNVVDLNFLQVDRFIDAKTLSESVKDMVNYLREGKGELVELVEGGYHRRFYLTSDRKLSVTIAYGPNREKKPILTLEFQVDKERLYRLVIDETGNLIDNRRFLDTDHFRIDLKPLAGEALEVINNVSQNDRRLAYGTIMKIISHT